MLNSAPRVSFMLVQLMTSTNKHTKERQYERNKVFFTFYYLQSKLLPCSKVLLSEWRYNHSQLPQFLSIPYQAYLINKVNLIR